MMPPHCTETSLDRNGVPRCCVIEAGHEGDHMDHQARTWEPPGTVLARLRETWGRTHRIIWTGRMWIATAHRDDVHWRTEVEPTPAQLEESLQKHSRPPDRPRARSASSAPSTPSASSTHSAYRVLGVTDTGGTP
jgi:hypothetical protein